MLNETEIVQKYLRCRGITIPTPASIRACTVRRHGQSFPAMIAAVQRAEDRKIIAVQATMIRDDGTDKISIGIPRMTIGALGTGAVRLAAATDVVGLAEGVETGLSAMQLFQIPVWCALGGTRMHRVAIPESVRDLIVFADNDATGRRYAERTAHEHREAGRRVEIRTPREVKDWNDLLCRRTAEAAA
ncbi:MAG: toprim domain-containing protein [Rhodopseudomonas sp.]|uniref:toprim domain-containing protein n=1 Tax=Rhodopseudomonas sp. TaxID=1078 RepID=UPI0017D72B89|nr:toprim domain-containing protein [Rhodopseudomonas sp.]NVN88600.1 toprim domain-containing protein [Rhodopseudomonas sp.]